MSTNAVGTPTRGVVRPLIHNLQAEHFIAGTNPLEAQKLRNCYKVYRSCMASARERWEEQQQALSLQGKENDAESSVEHDSVSDPAWQGAGRKSGGASACQLH